MRPCRSIVSSAGLEGPSGWLDPSFLEWTAKAGQKEGWDAGAGLGS